MPKPLPGQPEVTLTGRVTMAAAERAAWPSEDGGDWLVGKSAGCREDSVAAGR